MNHDYEYWSPEETRTPYSREEQENAPFGWFGPVLLVLALGIVGWLFGY